MGSLEDFKPLKEFYGEMTVKDIAENIKKISSDFDRKGFLFEVLGDLDNLTYKKRLDHIASGLRKYLPKKFKKAVEILLASIDNELENCDKIITWVHSNFIALYGIDDFETSMEALYKLNLIVINEAFTRPFLVKYPQETYKLFRKWAHDKHDATKWLVCASLRPTMTFAVRVDDVIKNPAPALEILSMMKDDKSKLVRNAVADALNDIAKYQSNMVVDTLKKWKTENSSEECSQTINAALDMLTNTGISEALELLGYKKDVKLELMDFRLEDDNVKAEEAVKFSLKYKLNEKSPAKVKLDYAMYFYRPGRKYLGKIFKIKNDELVPGKEYKTSRKYRFRTNRTIKFHRGVQKIEILCNQKIIASKEFFLDL